MVDETRVDVHRMVTHIMDSLTGQIPGVASTGIPLSPQKKDYEHLQWWEQDPWQAIRNNSRIKPSDSTSTILSLYFEDEDSKEILNEVKEEVRGDLFAYWLDMAREGEMPVAFQKLGFKRKQHYYSTMEGKFHWLQLCAGHWKVRQLWVNHWKKDTPEKLLRIIDETQSSNSHSASKTRQARSAPPKETSPGVPIAISSETKDSSPVPDKQKTPPTPIMIDSDMHPSPVPVKRKLPGPVIEINSSSKGSTPTGLKRKSGSDSDPGSSPSKKFKGKGKENAAPPFHHPRALSKKEMQRAAQKVAGKITAKVGKVSEGIFRVHKTYANLT